MCLRVSVKLEKEILQQVVTLLNEEEQALARGLTTGQFDRSDAVRQRDKHREVTKTLLTWLVRRQTFERSPAW